MRLCVILLALLLSAGPLPASAAPVSGPRAGLRHALAVLHGWDERRASAWAGSDERALAGLYARGSTAARADVRLLRSYTARGLVLRRMDMQVFGLRVLRSGPSRLVVRVLDRVAGGEVGAPDGVVPLPSSPPVVRLIELRRRRAGWQVVSVTGWG
jgi:hypothetical protein